MELTSPDAAARESSQVTEIFRHIFEAARRGRVKRGQLYFGARKLAKLGSTGTALQLAKLTTSCLGFPSDLSSLNVILHACGRNGDLAGAEECFHWMVFSGLRPNRMSYCSLIFACQWSLNAEGLKRWVKAMQSADIALPPGFMRRLLSVLHRLILRASDSLPSSDQRSLVEFEQDWLLYLLSLGIPMDKVSRRLLLSHIAKRMWEYHVELDPTLLAEMGQACCDAKDKFSSLLEGAERTSDAHEGVASC